MTGIGGGIAILVKTPRVSPVKTRLAASIGAAQAERFFRLSVAAIETTVRQFCDLRPGWHAHWVVTEPRGLTDPLWQNFPAQDAGPGGLGARMQAAYGSMVNRYGAGVLLGGDCPQVTVDILSKAADAILRHGTVLGPSHDGGFYLFGGRLPVADQIWLDTAYSRSDTAAEFINRLARQDCDPGLLPPLTDVDEAYDLGPMLAEMPDDKNVHQLALEEWARPLI